MHVSPSSNCPRSERPGEPVWLTNPSGPHRPRGGLGRWLFDRGSLTQHLINASHSHFAVQVLHQGVGYPRRAEARALQLAPRRRAVIREVILSGYDQPWVFARSILPLTTLTGRLRALRHLDNRPLGAMLFKDPDMRRSPIEIARIAPAHRILPADIQPELPVWGRRSVFVLDQKPLLVCEIFLDTFDPTHHPLDRTL